MNKCSTILVASALVLGACGSSDVGSDTNAVQSGAWRVVVDDHQVGGPIDAGIHTATDAGAFDELWASLGRGGDQPTVDFDDEIVIAYSLSYPSGCAFPFIDFDIDESDAVITASYAGNEPAECAADENQYLVVIGVDRDALMHPEYQVTTSVGGQVATLRL